MHFYRERLSYGIDQTSPSCFNQRENYEILSKPITATRTTTTGAASKGAAEVATSAAGAAASTQAAAAVEG